jgi:hypothetical protein
MRSPESKAALLTLSRAGVGVAEGGGGEGVSVGSPVAVAGGAVVAVAVASSVAVGDFVGDGGAGEPESSLSAAAEDGVVAGPSAQAGMVARMMMKAKEASTLRRDNIVHLPSLNLC